LILLANSFIQDRRSLALKNLILQFTKRMHVFKLEKLLDLCQEKGWLKSRMRHRTDSTHVLGAILAVTRLECVGETLRAALNTLLMISSPYDLDARYAKKHTTSWVGYEEVITKNSRRANCSHKRSP
jgi:hypothetical protein